MHQAQSVHLVQIVSERLADLVREIRAATEEEAEQAVKHMAARLDESALLADKLLYGFLLSEERSEREVPQATWQELLEVFRRVMDNSFSVDDVEWAVKELSGLVDTEALFRKTVPQGEEDQPESLGGKVPTIYAQIEFEHEVMAEDSTEYQTVLEDLHRYFADRVAYESELRKGDVFADDVRDSIVTSPEDLADKIKPGVGPDEDEIRMALREGKEADMWQGDSLSEVGRRHKDTTVSSEIFGDSAGGQGYIPLKYDFVAYANRVKKQASIDPGIAELADFPEGDQQYFMQGNEMEFVEASHALVGSPLVYDPDPFIEADLSTDTKVIVHAPQEDDRIEATIGDGEASESYQIIEAPLYGELHDEPKILTYVREPVELTGDLAEKEQMYTNQPEHNELGFKTVNNPGTVKLEQDTGVYALAESPTYFRRRPNLEKDKIEYPEFEHICEHYVCEDWLQVPLRDFNYAAGKGYYDPVTFEPYFPTGETDENGMPYILAPYSILHEPISEGINVGGQQIMAINPCNLSDVIQYLVKVYDFMRGRFIASTPVDVMSRVLNMLYGEIEKLVEAWDETKAYTPDEMWRIYRFVRWLAIGVTNRFYRLKLVHTFSDYVELLNGYISARLKTKGAVLRWAGDAAGNVIDAHPYTSTEVNWVETEFEIHPSQSSVISFDLGNIVPPRPTQQELAGVILTENFDGSPAGYKVKGTGWVPVKHLSGYALAVENPAEVKTYSTDALIVPDDLRGVRLSFDYSFDTNMDSRLLVVKEGETDPVWSSDGRGKLGTAVADLTPGRYRIQTNVPQSEGAGATRLQFSSTNIKYLWLKYGYQKWDVEGDYIYVDENTPMSMAVNPQWMKEIEYTFECELTTRSVPNYPEGYEDWIGMVFNFKDDANYYAVGMVTATNQDFQSKCGIWKVERGAGAPNEAVPPKWTFQNPGLTVGFNQWRKLRVVVNGNRFQVYVDGVLQANVTDQYGWGGGSCGLATYSNPYSSWRVVSYTGKPRFDCFIDNVEITAAYRSIQPSSPSYAIRFLLDDKVLYNFSDNAKVSLSFPILKGRHKARWEFRKNTEHPDWGLDFSYLDNLRITNCIISGASVEEEFIGCGGQLGPKLLIENLLEYYKRHHEACKGRRDVWIIE